MTEKSLKFKDKKQISHFKILEANTIFLVLAGVFLTLGAYVQSKEVLSGLLITEYGIILIPILLYSVLTKKSIKSVFRLHKIPVKTFFKIILVAILLLPVIVVANLITLLLIEIFSSSISTDIPTATTQGEYLILMFIISLTAGICEEFFFRGMILDAYEHKLGRKWGAIFSGLLFGVFHYNPQNLLGPIILGIVFAYLVQVTGSIIAGVVAHATNNGIAVSLGFLVNNFSGYTTNASSIGMADLGVLDIVIVMAFYGFLALLTVVGLRAMLRSIKKDHPDFALGNEVMINNEPFVIKANDQKFLFVKSLNDVNDFSHEEAQVQTASSEEDLLEGVKRVSIEKLKKHAYTLITPFWPKRQLHLSTLEIIPLVLTLLMYAFIIYYAYF